MAGIALGFGGWRKRDAWLPAIAAAVMALGDLGAHVMNRNALEWLVGSSLPRLLVQIWPLALLAFFLALGEEPAPEAVPVAVAKQREGKRGKRR